MVEGVAAQGRRDLARDLAASLGLDGRRSNGVEIGYLCLLPLVVHAEEDVIQRIPPQGLQPQPVDGVVGAEAAAGSRTVEVLEGELPVEHFRAERQVRIQKIGVGPTDGGVAVAAAQAAADHELLPAAEQVALLDARRADQARGRVEPRAHAERAGLRFLHIDQHVQQIAARPAARGDVHVREIPQALHPVAAELQAAGVELALLGDA